MIGQYLHYLNNILHGNFGISTSYYPSTVASVIKGALPWTLALVGVATVISFILGTLLGVVVAWRRGSWMDNVLPAMTFFQAAPLLLHRVPGPGAVRGQARLVPRRRAPTTSSTSPR